MGASSNAIPGPHVPVVDRYRRWTAEWYPWIKRLLSQLQSVEQTAVEISTDVTEISAKYTIELNVSNQVTGIVQLSGDASGSTFDVLADNFRIAHPTSASTVATVFQSGISEGNPYVGINGAVVVDGTVSASALDVDTLSAISADIGTVTAGVVQSSDGSMVIDLDNGTISISS